MTPHWSAPRKDAGRQPAPTCAGPTPSSSTRSATTLLWPDEPFQLGKVFEMNDHRAVLVGICQASLTFQTLPLVYTRYQPGGPLPAARRKDGFGHPGPGRPERARRRSLRPHSGADRPAGADAGPVRLADHRSLPAADRHPDQLRHDRAAGFHGRRAISGQTFYSVHAGEPAQFGMLKAMGTSNADHRHDPAAGGGGRLHRLRAGGGRGGAVRRAVEGNSKLVFFMPWQVLVGDRRWPWCWWRWSPACSAFAACWCWSQPSYFANFALFG